MALLYRVKKELSMCKHFSQEFVLLNPFIIKVLQNLLFYIVKAAVLHGKSVGFASQNSRFRNAKSKLPFFVGIIFTKQGLFLGFAFGKKKEIEMHNILMLNLTFVFFPRCGKLHFQTFMLDIHKTENSSKLCFRFGVMKYFYYLCTKVRNEKFGCCSSIASRD